MTLIYLSVVELQGISSRSIWWILICTLKCAKNLIPATWTSQNPWDQLRAQLAHLCTATFQQCVNLGLKYPNWHNNSSASVSCHGFLQSELLLIRKLLHKGFLVNNLNHPLESFTNASSSWFGWPQWNICVIMTKDIFNLSI